MHTRRKYKKTITRRNKTKKSKTMKSKKGGGWVGDFYLFKAIKRNFFPSQEDKERNLFYKAPSSTGASASASA